MTVVSAPRQTAGSVTVIVLTATPFAAEIALAQWSSLADPVEREARVLLRLELAARAHLRAHARREHRGDADEHDRRGSP